MSTSTQPIPQPLLTYDGRTADLYRIFLINLLLNIVTLGIWRFWGITRTRRYLWSRTSSNGSRFEYDGTGGQLFVGFLLAMLVILGMLGVAFGCVVALRGHGFVAAIPIILVYVGILVLALGAPFSAQRYRLSHTVWRGIRGGMEGSMLAYGLRALGYVFLMVVSFYQCIPWASLRLLERRINASSFGNQRFAARGKPGQLYVRFLLTFLAVAVLVAVVFATTWVFVEPLFKAAGLAAQQHQPVDPRISRGITFAFLPAYLVVGLGASLISASYTAAFFRHITSHTTLGGIQFSSAVTTGTVIRLIAGNALLLIVTLGFGMPIVTQRNVRYFTSNLLATGSLDLATLGQNEQRVSRFGEGMFQALDAGAGIA
jgi:uncharacterized membrane protein YjgN (DUF898 family)